MRWLHALCSVLHGCAGKNKEFVLLKNTLHEKAKPVTTNKGTSKAN
jgi:hypothetical protein